MKKALIFISVLMIAFSATSQIYQAQQSNGFQYKRLKIDTALHIPTFCGTPFFRGMQGSQDSATAAIAFDTCAHLLYYFDPSTKIWSTITGSAARIITYLKFPLYAYDSVTIAEYHDDGLVTPASVTHLHDSTFYVNSGIVYWINGIEYTTGGDTVTLSGIDPDLPVKFLFIVDTTGHASFLRGTPATIPLDTVATPGVSLALTSGITFQAGATEPDNVIVKPIFNENLGNPDEWAPHTQGASGTYNFGNTDNPQSGVKDLFISKYNNGFTPYFVAPANDTITSDELLYFWIYINGPYVNKSLYAQFYDNTTAATAQIRITSAHGLNVNDSGHYQQIAVPLNQLTWSGNYSGHWNTLLFKFFGTDTTGAQGIFVDNIQLQKGINSIPPATDYSYKVDSSGTHKVNDSTYVNWYAVKGVKHYSDTIKILSSGGTGGTVDTLPLHNQIIDLQAGKLNISDTAAMLSPYPNRQELSDSSAAIRADFPTAGTGTVTSVAKGYGLVADGTITSTGTITLDSAALSLKYVRIADTAAMLAPYLPSNSPSLLSFYFTSLKNGDYLKLDSINNRWINFTPTPYTYTPPIDTTALFVFGGGGGNAADTSSFTTSTVYGSFFNSLSDTLVLTRMQIGLQGTSPNVTVRIYWNDSLNVTAGATPLTASGTSATNIYGGTSVTSFANTKIPPNVWVWCTTSVVTTKPTYMTVTLIGYKNRTL